MKHLIITLIIVALSFTANAQEILDTLPSEWSLEYCIDYAIRNNIQINSQRLSSKSANEDLKQAQASKLPNLSASVTQNLVNSNNADPVVGGFQTQASFSSGYSVSSAITLYNGGYIKNDVKSKELSLQSSNLAVHEVANSITLSITQAYLNILLAQENITALETVLQTSKVQLKQGEQRFDAGALSKKSLLQLQSQAASDNYNLTNAQNNYRLNLVSLKQILQLPAEYNFVVNIPHTVVVKEAVPSLDNAQKAALSTRPEVASANLDVQIAQTELEKVRAATKPTISVGAGLSTGYSNNQDYKYTSQLNSNFYQSLGLTASIPIYSRRVNKTNIEKSKIQIEQSRLSLLDTKTTLNQQVEQAFINLQNAQAQYDAASQQLNASEESYNITNQQLQLGAINIVELQQQRQSYVQALQAYLQSKYAAVLYNKIYTFYTGEAIKF